MALSENQNKNMTVEMLTVRISSCVCAFQRYLLFVSISEAYRIWLLPEQWMGK